MIASVLDVDNVSGKAWGQQVRLYVEALHGRRQTAPVSDFYSWEGKKATFLVPLAGAVQYAVREIGAAVGAVSGLSVRRPERELRGLYQQEGYS